MARKADEGWFTKNGKSVVIPPYKAPRQKTTKGKHTPKVSERVTEVLDSEDKGKEVVEVDSEDDTQLGLVWGSPGKTVTETELEDSDGEGDNIPFSELKEKRKADKPQPIEDVGDVLKDRVYPYVFIPETEVQVSETVKEITVGTDGVPSGELCVGKSIMKEFGEGLFKGYVTTAIKKRGRFLYHVVYEDGDEEDLNDREFREAYDLFIESGKESFQNKDKDIEAEHAQSGGETEGSDYDVQSDEEVLKKARKKRRTTVTKTIKEKGSLNGGKKSQKEVDPNEAPTIKRGKKKPTVINVEALYKSGNKYSVMHKTIEGMTDAQKEDVLGSAEKKLVTIAKKGLRVQAMKVCTVMSLVFFISHF